MKDQDRSITEFESAYMGARIELVFDNRDNTVRITSDMQWLNKTDLKDFIKVLKQLKKGMK